jgi:hypothetical protein
VAHHYAITGFYSEKTGLGANDYSFQNELNPTFAPQSRIQDISQSVTYQIPG